MSNAASDFNMQKLNTKQLADNIRATIDFGGNLIVVGRRGSAKTASAKQQIAASGCREVYLNLSTMERPDMGGYPNFHGKNEGGYIEFLLPAFYKALMQTHDEDGNALPPAVALLDEVDKAEPALWAPLLEFIQFHSINGRPLANLRAVIMTGNLVAEGGQRPCLPLLDRAEKYLLEPTVHHWLDWGRDSGEIHPSVAAFIADHPEELFGDVDNGDLYADPSPRGWHNGSKILFFGEARNWNTDLLTDKVAGCIGKKAGIRYRAYFEHYKELLPVIEKILKGEPATGFEKFDPGKQMVACMISCARFAMLLDSRKNKKQLPVEADYVSDFLLNSGVDPETVLVSVRSQIGLKKFLETDLGDHPAWSSILDNLKKRVNGV